MQEAIQNDNFSAHNMTLSSLPRYPNPAAVRPEDAAGNRDWRLLLSRLIIITGVGGFITFGIVVLALVATMGRILEIFDWIW